MTNIFFITGSGRSSNDGEATASASQSQIPGSSSNLPALPQGEAEGENKNKYVLYFFNFLVRFYKLSNFRNHKLLLAFLDCLIDALPELDRLNGIHCISYMQVTVLFVIFLSNYLKLLLFLGDHKFIEFLRLY